MNEINDLIDYIKFLTDDDNLLVFQSLEELRLLTLRLNIELQEYKQHISDRIEIYEN